MKKISWIALCFVMFCAQEGWTHNPQVSFVRISRQQQVWTMSMSSALMAFHSALVDKYPNLDFEKIPHAQLIGMVIHHIQQTVDIQANDNQQITLEKGMISPGHQTDLLFELKGMPKEVQSLSVKVNSFEHDRSHTSILLLSTTANSDKFYLNSDNHYTTYLQLGKDDIFRGVKTWSHFKLLDFRVLGVIGGLFVLSGMLIFTNKYFPRLLHRGVSNAV